ncbi:MAG: hypothetical protein H6679_03905 [Epsilonproteobacteria bacterium]|nr:hypothetical protein [Campylobacterota bacterium]
MKNKKNLIALFSCFTLLLINPANSLAKVNNQKKSINNQECCEILACLKEKVKKSEQVISSINVFLNNIKDITSLLSQTLQQQPSQLSTIKENLAQLVSDYEQTKEKCSLYQTNEDLWEKFIENLKPLIEQIDSSIMDNSKQLEQLNQYLVTFNNMERSNDLTWHEKFMQFCKSSEV